MFVMVNDLERHCTGAGRGIPCLVPSLAGTPIHERTFSSPALLDHLQLFFAEVRANRTAVGDLDRTTSGGVVDEIDGLRAALGLERVAILGHSAHAILALAYAARYPQQTSRVIVVAGVPHLSADFEARRATYWDLVASPGRKRLLAAGEARRARSFGGARSGEDQ